MSIRCLCGANFSRMTASAEAKTVKKKHEQLPNQISHLFLGWSHRSEMRPFLGCS